MLDQLGPRPDDLAGIEHLLQARCGQTQVVDQCLNAARPGHFFPPLTDDASVPVVAVSP